MSTTKKHAAEQGDSKKAMLRAMVPHKLAAHDLGWHVRMSREKRPGFGWNKKAPADREELADSASSLALTAWGIQISGDTLGIDVDVEDRALSGKIMEAMRDIFGDALNDMILIEREGSEKFKLLARRDPADADPISMTTSGYYPPGADPANGDKAQMIEFGTAAHARYYAIEGVNRFADDGTPQLYRPDTEGPLPWTHGPEQLPVVTRDQLAALHMAWGRIAEEAGWTFASTFEKVGGGGHAFYTLPEGALDQYAVGDRPAPRDFPFLGDKSDTKRLSVVEHPRDRTVHGLHDFKHACTYWPPEAENKAHGELQSKVVMLYDKLCELQGKEVVDARITRAEEEREASKRGAQRAKVVVVQSNISEAVDGALDALGERDDWYRYGDALAYMGDDGHLRVCTEEVAARYALDKCIVFQKIVVERDKDEGEKKSLIGIKPTVDLVRMVASEGRYSELRKLDGISDVPLLRPDGTIQTEPGYDPATRMFLQPKGEPIYVPETPTLEDARAALDEIEDVFDEFAAATPEDRGALLALVLTAATRRSFDVAPGFVLDAPDTGHGKTTLGYAAQAVAGKRNVKGVVPANTLRDDEKLARALHGAIRGNEPSMLFDNVKGILKGEVLAAVLTSGAVSVNVLYSNDRAELPLRMLQLFSSNQAGLDEDIARRVLNVRLDRGVENASANVDGFRHEHVELVAEERRMQLVAAALTLVRAKETHAPDLQARGVGSYRNWDRLIRRTVLWVGQTLDERYGDPAGTIERSKADTAGQESGKMLFAFLHAAFGSAPFQVRDVLHYTRPGVVPGRDAGLELTHKMVTDFRYLAQAEACPPGGREVTPQSLGLFLRRYKDRIIDGRVLRDDGVTDGSKRWRLL